MIHKTKITISIAFLSGLLFLGGAFLTFNTSLFQSNIISSSSGSTLAETGTGSVAFGVFYFPGWAPENYHWSTFRSIKNEFPEREKVDGWEDMTTIGSMNKEITWASSHGVDYFIFDWYWDNVNKQEAKHASSNLAYAIPAFKAANNGRMKYTIMWCDHDAGYKSDEDLELMISYMEKNYFSDPDFMKTPDGKPFYTFWSNYDLIVSLGKQVDQNGNLIMDPNNPSKPLVDWNRGTQRTKAFLGKLKERYNVYIASISDGISIPVDEQNTHIGVDAMIGWGYLNGIGIYGGGSVTQYEVFKNNAARIMSDIYRMLPHIKTKMLPGILPGRNEKPWHALPATQLLQTDPKFFEEQLKLSYQMLAAQELSFKTIVIQSWNEMGEGAYLIPTKQWKFGALEAVKKVKACMAKNNCDLPAIPEEFLPKIQEPSVSTNVNSNTQTLGTTNTNNTLPTQTQGNSNSIVSPTTVLPNKNTNATIQSTTGSGVNVPSITTSSSLRTSYVGAGASALNFQLPTALETLKSSAPGISPFQDIKGHFAEKAIIQLYEAGIIQGRTKGIFAPFSQINRAEALKMILGTSFEKNRISTFFQNFRKDHPLYTYAYFQDTPMLSWFAPYVSFGYEQKIIQGVSKNSFAPEKAVTRAEFIKMVIASKKMTTTSPSSSHTFRDVTDRDWFAPYVSSAVAAGLIDKKASFEPQRAISRGEAAKILALLLSQ